MVASPDEEADIYARRKIVVSDLFDQAKAFDLAIANRWKMRTGDDPTRELSLSDVEFIAGPVLRGQAKITERQGQALTVIFDNTRSTQEAARRVQGLIRAAHAAGRFNEEHLDTDAELAPILEALGNDVVGQIIFKSPGTTITYAPFEYQAIGKLILKKRIKVFEIRVAALSRPLAFRGIYNTDRNRLVINQAHTVDPLLRKITIVHEVTHAIQDWRDVESLAHDEEADAEIAEAIAHHALRGAFRPASQEEPWAPKVAAAAEFVIQKRADGRNQQWGDAYKELVKAMADLHKKEGVRSSRERRGPRESEIYRWEALSAENRQVGREAVKRSGDEMSKSMKGIDLAKYIRKPGP